MSKMKDYYRVVSPSIATTMVQDNQLADSGYAATNNFTWYARLIQGSGTRLARYNEYNIMDNDVEIARALDIIAEEMTSKNSKTRLPLDIDMLIEDGQQVDDTLILTLRTALRHWSKIHQFDANRLFKISRNMVKYGDCFFRKRSHYKQWEWIPASAVVGAIVSEQDVTKVLGFQIRTDTKEPAKGAMGANFMKNLSGQGKIENVPIDQLVVFTINDDMSESAPFGESVLRTVYKTHKQKELLEDAIVIYRIQRAPERRVFYVDVGKMPPHRVKAYLETIKNEIKQKKIPSMNNNGQPSVDSIYNPHCLSLDTLIPLLDGRTLSLSEIINEYEENTLWAYSIDPLSGEFAPGIISWAGITKRNTEVIKLTFDNGKSLICTPDHKIPVYHRGFVEANDLKISDKLCAHTTLLSGKTVYDYHNKAWIDIDFIDGKVFWSNEVNQDIDIPFTYITSIESLTDNIDVGTLTIDQNESIHNYHTFAVDAGIYVKNSTGEDIYLAQRCIALDTKLNIVNVGTLSLFEVIKRFVEGIPQRVYTIDQDTGERSIGDIGWAGVTKLNTPVLKVVLSNHHIIECTPDHKFVMNDHTEKQACELVSGDQLCSDLVQVVVVQVIDEGITLNTGCITVNTIDNNHNFLLESGIFIKNSDGVGSKVEVLPGGQNLGELTDLVFFSNKVMRGLRVPIAWMGAQGDKEGGIFNDGKIGAAYIEEQQFAKFVERLQFYVQYVLDYEFKKYLKACNIKVDASLFRVTLPVPSNYEHYRQAELDNTLLSAISTAENISWLSKRFIARRYLQLTEDEVLTNEQLVKQERGLELNGDKTLAKVYNPQPEGMEGMGGDMGMGGYPPEGGLGGMPSEMGAQPELGTPGITPVQPTTPTV